MDREAKKYDRHEQLTARLAIDRNGKRKSRNNFAVTGAKRRRWAVSALTGKLFRKHDIHCDPRHFLAFELLY
jgi:hypothetical protein